jgi:hypothetical protein
MAHSIAPAGRLWYLCNHFNYTAGHLREAFVIFVFQSSKSIVQYIRTQNKYEMINKSFY